MTDAITTVEDVLAGIVPAETTVRCPFHDDATPSARVYADGSFHCFGCHASYTRVGLVAKLHYGDLPRFQAMSLATAELAQGGMARLTPAPSHTPKPVRRPSDLGYRTLTAMTTIATAELARRPELVARIAADRGLRDPLALGLGWAADDLGERIAHAMGFSPSEAEHELVAAGIAYAQRAGDLVRPPAARPRLGRHRLLIPDVHGTGPHATTHCYQARATTPGTAVKYLSPPRLAKPLFGLASLRQPTAHVWLAEGPFDVLPLIELGEAAVATTGSHLKAGLVLDLVDAARGRAILVAYDADPAGRRQAPVVAALLADAGARVRVVEPPAPFTDLGEWCAAAGADEVVAEITWAR